MIPHPALAVQWRPLATTTRHKVTIDNASIRLNALGRLEVWLRFVPRSEIQRKAAAADYGEKNYRSHMEFYEIDCSEQNAVLGLIDIYGISKTRLKRLKGGVQPDAVIPGSVLEKAADKVCPALDQEAYKEEQEAPDTEMEGETGSQPDAQVDTELQDKIRDLEKKSLEDPTNLETWRLLGNACFDANLSEQAISAYNRALALKPDDTDILNDQGAMYRQIGEFSKAVANFEKAFKVDPKNLESLYNSGYVYAFDLNNIPKALEIWQLYLKLDSNSEAGRTVKGFVERYQKNQTLN